MSENKSIPNNLVGKRGTVDCGPLGKSHTYWGQYHGQVVEITAAFEKVWDDGSNAVYLMCQTDKGVLFEIDARLVVVIIGRIGEPVPAGAA